MAGPNYAQNGYSYTPYTGYPSPAFAQPAFQFMNAAASPNPQVPVNYYYSASTGISSFDAQPAIQSLDGNGQAPTWNDLLSQFSALMEMFSQYPGANTGGGIGGTPGIPSWMSTWSSPDLSSILGPTGTGVGAWIGTKDAPHPQNKNPNAVQVRILEVGSLDPNNPNGGNIWDRHSATVNDIFNTTLNQWGGASGANLKKDVLDSNKLPPGAIARPEQYNSKEDLDQFIDNDSTYALAQMTKEINATKSGVVNASMGWSRDSIYKDVVGLIKEHPNLAKELGLSESDAKNIPMKQVKDANKKPIFDRNGQPVMIIDLEKLPDKFKTAVMKYVDNRLKPETSAYKKALGAYQKAAHTAAGNDPSDPNRNVTIVVAAGNDQELSKIFNAKQGADTNFLALSHDVISVAAMDTKGTADTSDDVIGDFSSSGNVFKPTIAATGVNFQTNILQENGKNLVKGTSYSAPRVTALITRMLEINPKLTPAQIKNILKHKDVAIDNPKISDLAEGAGLVNINKALELAKNPPTDL